MIKVNKPKIRFKNFNDSWSLRKLSDTQTDFKDGNYGEAYPKETDLTSSTQGVPFLRGSDLDNGKLTLTNARYITQSKHNELISGHLIEDDIVIAVRGSLGSLGYVGPDNEGWNINSQLAIIRTRKIELIGNYLIQFLLSNRGNKEISSHITGTALKQLPIKQLKNIKVPIPKIDEQSAIGSLFRTLDDLLANYKDNLANYQSLKATMLSKMFPKAGQTVPEIRLAGFEGKWEEKEFIQIVNRVTESSDSDSLPKVEFEDIISGQGKLNKDISSKFDNRKGILFKPGYTLYGKLRPYLNNWFLPKFEGVALGDFWVFDPNGNNSDFIYYLVQSSRYQKVANDTSGTKMPRSDWKSVSTTIFAIPQTIAEQQAIGSYFSNLDNLINSHQEKISQLETLKKKLLQDMFI